MLAGVIGAGVVGFMIYGILLWPLRKMTRRLYPQAIRIGQAAEECAAAGRKISTDLANETSAELIQRRDAHLEAAKRWKADQLERTGRQNQRRTRCRKGKVKPTRRKGWGAVHRKLQQNSLGDAGKSRCPGRADHRCTLQNESVAARTARVQRGSATTSAGTSLNAIANRRQQRNEPHHPGRRPS